MYSKSRSIITLRESCCQILRIEPQEFSGVAAHIIGNAVISAGFQLRAGGTGLADAAERAGGTARA